MKLQTGPFMAGTVDKWKVPEVLAGMYCMPSGGGRFHRKADEAHEHQHRHPAHGADSDLLSCAIVRNVRFVGEDGVGFASSGPAGDLESLTLSTDTGRTLGGSTSGASAASSVYGLGRRARPLQPRLLLARCHQSNSAPPAPRRRAARSAQEHEAADRAVLCCPWQTPLTSARCPRRLPVCIVCPANCELLPLIVLGSCTCSCCQQRRCVIICKKYNDGATADRSPTSRRQTVRELCENSSECFRAG